MKVVSGSRITELNIIYKGWDEMKPREAIETIKKNYPTSNSYSMLREALDMAMEALEEMEEEFFCCPNCGNIKKDQ